MTVPGGVISLPPGASTLDTLEYNLQNMSGAAMKARAVDRFPDIMTGSTGGSPAVDLSPFGILTSIWAGTNAIVANADPADIQGPEDLPGLLLDFIEGLPVIGQLVGLVEAVLGTYDGDDQVLLTIQSIFDPIRKLMQMITGVFTGFPSVEQVTIGFPDFIKQPLTDLVDILVTVIDSIPIIGPPVGNALEDLAAMFGLLKNKAVAAQTTAEIAQTTATATSTTQSQQTVAKPGYLAGDATADAVFPIASISGTTPSTIDVTAAASDIGFIDTPDNGKKSSIIWLGQNKTGLTAFYINLYQIDVTTGVLTLIEASPNILSSVSNALAWNYYNLATPITSAVGNVYAVEVVVSGSGTYKIAGIPGDWKPPNTVASYPQQLGAERTTGLPAAPASFTPTNSGTIPWFGLGGFEFAGPVTSPYTTGHGVFTYSIPNWLKYGDMIDVIAIGGGAGGQGSVFIAPGMGGNCGPWTTRTLIYGIDIPTTTDTLTITVGAGGPGGLPPTGAAGGNGGDTRVEGDGVLTVLAPGGIAPTVSGSHGIPGTGAGDVTFTTVTYSGGGDVTGTGGSFPGGGGSGAGPYGGGYVGADGAVWIAAYQAGTHP